MRLALSDRRARARRGLFLAIFAGCAPLVTAASAGCGGAPPPPAEPSEDAKAREAAAAAKAKADAEAAEKAAKKKDLPTACTPGADGFCAPPEDFAKQLCGGSFPDVALVFFRKDSPWTRGYLRRTMDAWSASGGSSSNSKVEVDEEVILLIHRAADTGGMQVSGSSGGSYEALRWDGACVSLTAEEVTTRLPPKAKYAKIPWTQLDVKTRESLASDEKVGPVVTEYRKECKGSFGEVTPKCEKVDKKLVGAIVDFIRGGGSIPPPTNVP